jgi:hypothetical protein
MTEPADPQTAENKPPTRSMAVGAAIAAAGLIFLVSAGAILYGWATSPEPTCVLIVEAPATFRGAEVSVKGGLDADYKVVIGGGDRFALPFYLQYGNYTVRVTLKEHELLRTEVELTREQPGRRLDLSKLPPPPMTAPSEAPDAPPPSPFVTPSLDGGGPPPAPLLPSVPPSSEKP